MRAIVVRRFGVRCAAFCLSFGVRRSICAVLFAVLAFDVHASTQTPAEQYKPLVGQAGKDVVWVPTAQTLVDKMLELARVTPQDYLIDLGSGDGRLVITAAKRGTRALGIEYNPDMVELSKRAAIEAGVRDKATFMKADIFESDFSQATVITMFLLPELNLRLRPKILDLKPGTRIVSNTFTMDDWQADEYGSIREGCSTWCTALLWYVPAKVAGTWRLGQGELILTQQFQMISGTLQSGGQTAPIADGRLRGADITFTVGSTHYAGHVSGNSMGGTAEPGNTAWTASRTNP